MTDAPDPAAFREAFGRFPTGVAVVTCGAADGHGPAGLTTNAVTSLSLDPLLLIVCFDERSRTLAAVRAAGRFAVSVLGEGQEDVARVFAGKAAGPEKLAAVAHRHEHGAPVVDGAVAWVVCDLEELLSRGDHAIGIGAVIAVGGPPAPAAPPLLFHGGAFTALGEERASAPPGVPPAA